MPNEYRVTKHELIIWTIPSTNTFTVTIKSMLNQIIPQNSLFISNIFYSLNRPDILSKITTTIISNKALNLSSLAAGKLISAVNAIKNVNEATWEDPTPKPSCTFGCLG